MKSYGILLYYTDEDNKKHFLIYQRRDTHAFIYLLRKAHIMKPYEIKELYDKLTFDEKNRLHSHSFDEVWDDLILNKKSRIYRKEKNYAQSNYKKIKELCKDVSVNDITLEWGFPKGRPMKNETIEKTALREFQEETNFDDKTVNDIKLYDKKLLYRLHGYRTELFVGKIDYKVSIKYNKSDTIRKLFVSPETNDLRWILSEDREDYLDKSLSRLIYYVDVTFT